MAATLLQITDCHLVSEGTTLLGVDTQASLESVLSQATSRYRFDAVVASGDLAHEPKQAIYERFLRTLTEYVSAPVMCLAGNHDVLGEMLKAKLPMSSLELDHWTVVTLDSHIDDTVESEVSEVDRANVREALSGASGKFVLVATHHPMVEINCPWIDKDRIQNPEELLEWLSECTQAARPRGTSKGIELRGVVFGHAHQAIDREYKGWSLLGCPSTCFQFLPESQSFALDTQSPGYRVIELHDDGSIQSVVERSDFPIEPMVRRRTR